MTMEYRPRGCQDEFRTTQLAEGDTVVYQCGCTGHCRFEDNWTVAKVIRKNPLVVDLLIGILLTGGLEFFWGPFGHLKLLAYLSLGFVMWIALKYWWCSRG